MVSTPVIRAGFEELPSAIKELSIPKHRVMLVADTNTAPLYGEDVLALLRGVFQEAHLYVFEAGEEHKTLRSVEGLLKRLMELKFDRKDCLAALGGGVVGDMAGFAAAIYLRGVPVLQLPTTLLSQIDSSIGGKTGVDLEGFKNMVGAFHLPSLVYTNPGVLSTLSAEQYSAGMGEVVKTALLSSGEFFSFLEENRDAINLREPAVVLEMIRRCAIIKTEIVQRDPKEQGERALLNLGHTIGHAIEKAMDFRMLHGHCVGVGLAAAAYMSKCRGYISGEELERILSVCRGFDIPVRAEGLDPETILRYTKSDKKMSNGQVRFIFLKAIGEAFYTDDTSDEELLEGIRFVCC